jgi:hypothetical protein
VHNPANALVEGGLKRQNKWQCTRVQCQRAHLLKRLLQALGLKGKDLLNDIPPNSLYKRGKTLLKRR